MKSSKGTAGVQQRRPWLSVSARPRGRQDIGGCWGSREDGGEMCKGRRFVLPLGQGVWVCWYVGISGWRTDTAEVRLQEGERRPQTISSLQFLVSNFEGVKRGSGHGSRKASAERDGAKLVGKADGKDNHS